MGISYEGPESSFCLIKSLDELVQWVIILGVSAASQNTQPFEINIMLHTRGSLSAFRFSKDTSASDKFFSYFPLASRMRLNSF